MRYVMILSLLVFFVAASRAADADTETHYLTTLRTNADQGNANAQYVIGWMYESGWGGVKQDFVQAYMWTSLAAASQNYAATKERDGIARKMTPGQIAKAKRLAAAWKPTPAPAAK
jgi:TPR repeat protein